MAQALADTGARILVIERGGVVPRKTRTGARPPSGRICATGRPSAGWTARRGVPAVHALRRRRQHEVLGQRALSPATGRFRGVEHVDGVSPAWPIDYDTLAPYYERAERLYHVHGQRRRRSDRAAARAVSLMRRFRTRRAWRTSSSASTAGAASITAAAGPHPARRSRRLPAMQTPAIRSRAASTRRATRTSAASCPPWRKRT